MLKNKLKFKILTSIFIVLFFIVFFNSFSYALTGESTIDTYFENDTTLQSELANYNYCFYVSSQYVSTTQYNGYFVYTNEYPINMTGTYNASGYFTNTLFNISSGKVYHLIRSRTDRAHIVDSTIDVSFDIYGVSNTPYTIDWSEKIKDYKGSNTFYMNNNLLIQGVAPIPAYDFSFSINDHVFDLNMEDYTFDNGVTLSSDDLKEGHYVVSLQSFVKNTYYENYSNYWAQGFIDYFPYSDSNPDQYFFMSTGYNTLRIRNTLNDDSYFYRFYFKGYSSDSAFTDDTYNIITSIPDNYDIWHKYYAPKNNTFVYSNQDIYWGNDSSLYGFTSLSSNIYFDSSVEPEYSIVDYPEYTYTNRDSDQESTTFAIGNNVYNYPSTNATITHNDLYDYNNNPISSVSNYDTFSNSSGNNLVPEDTSNWTTIDYLKNIPNQLSKIPDIIGDALKSLFIPNNAQLVDLYTRFQDFSTNHLGVLNAPISFIMEFLGDISTKYDSNYSYYPFTIPGFRWFNMATGQKETIVESRTIDLGSYFMDDDDWFYLWNSLRMIVSILIFINLIIMLFNLYQRIIHGQRANINNSNIGDLSRKE